MFELKFKETVVASITDDNVLVWQERERCPKDARDILEMDRLGLTGGGLEGDGKFITTVQIVERGTPEWVRAAIDKVRNRGLTVTRWLSVREAADGNSVVMEAIRALLRDGAVRGRKVRGRWQIDEEEWKRADARADKFLWYPGDITIVSRPQDDRSVK